MGVAGVGRRVTPLPLEGTQGVRVISDLAFLCFHFATRQNCTAISRTSKMAFQLLVFIDSLNFRKDHSGPFSLIMKTRGNKMFLT